MFGTREDWRVGRGKEGGSWRGVVDLLRSRRKGGKLGLELEARRLLGWPC